MISLESERNKLGYFNPGSRPSSSAESIGGYLSGSLAPKSAHAAATISRWFRNEAPSPDPKTFEDLLHESCPMVSSVFRHRNK